MGVLRFWRLGVGAAVLLSVGAALAADPLPSYPECNKKPSQQDIEGAKGAHNAAKQFYDRADYDKAIRYWNDAYGFDCTANGLLNNIGNAYEKKGDKPSAVVAYETYLAREKNPDPTIPEKVKNLKAQMQAEADAAAKATAAASAPPPPPVVTAPPLPPEPPPPPVRPYGASPWILVGGGGASLLAGLILLPVGASAISEAGDKCPEKNGQHVCSKANAKYADEGSRGRAEVAAGWVTASVGAGAIAGGLVWQFVFNKPPPAEPAKTGVKVQPMLGPGHTGAVVSGSF